jgi:hypothetical protein
MFSLAAVLLLLLPLLSYATTSSRQIDKFQMMFQNIKHEFTQHIHKFKPEEYASRTENYWRQKGYIVNPIDNPLLKSLSMEDTEEALDLTELVDPSTKFKDWHIKSKNWGFQFWSAVLQLQNDLLVELKSDTLDITTTLEKCGQWRHYVYFKKFIHDTSNRPLVMRDDLLELMAFGHFQQKAYAGDNLNLEKHTLGVETSNGYPYSELDIEKDLRVSDIYLMDDEDLTDFINRDPVEPLSPIQNDPDFKFRQPYKNMEISILTRPAAASKIKLVEFKRIKAANYNCMWKVYNSFRKPEIEMIMSTLLRRIVQESQERLHEKQEYIKMVATLHWFMAVTSPYARGSASVADLLTATMFMLRGIIWPGWAENISADVTALSTGKLATYQQLFAKLLAQ